MLYFNVKRRKRPRPIVRPVEKKARVRRVKVEEPRRVQPAAGSIRPPLDSILKPGLSYAEQKYFLTDDLAWIRRMVVRVVLQALSDLADNHVPPDERKEAWLFMLLEAGPLLAKFGILVRIDVETLPIFIERRKAYGKH